VSPDPLRIGSRGSDLALWQARWVQGELARLHPGLGVEIEIIRTTGDRILDSPLSAIGDKGLFTKEIETALLDGRVDLAVHSLKDLPTRLPDGLALGAVCEREDVRDAFIPHPRNPERTLGRQPTGASVATGSLRRKCQLLALRPDLRIVDIRGNLNTRMRKLEESDWAGMMLAAAGVKRLGWEKSVGEVLDPLVILPAVGQGALGIEIRGTDVRTRSLVAPLHHAPTGSAALAERAFLRELEGGCQVPIGAFGRIEESPDGDRLLLDGVVGSLDGRTVIRGGDAGGPDRPEELGRGLAQRLLGQGAAAVLAGIRTSPHDPR
jgi:hydroxymethylbilane synthase